MPIKINYQPNLDYEKNYQTEGFIDSIKDSTQSTTVITPPTKDEVIKQINDKMDRISASMRILPNDIADAVVSPVSGAKYILSAVDQDNYDPTVNDKDPIDINYIPPDDSDDISSIIAPDDNADDGDIVTDSDNPEDEDTTVPDLFSDITDPFDYEASDINDVYYKRVFTTDVMDIIDDYLTSLEKKIADYLTTLTAIVTDASNVSVADILSPYDGDSGILDDPDSAHLSDYIIRSQIEKDQKLRTFRKLYDLTQTSYHIKACRVSAELRDRYYNEGYCKTSNLLDVNSNNLLDESRATYDKKYKENFTNLYKYLNSSVILIGECLQMSIKEAQAKATLLNRGLIGNESNANQ